MVTPSAHRRRPLQGAAAQSHFYQGKSWAQRKVIARRLRREGVGEHGSPQHTNLHNGTVLPRKSRTRNLPLVTHPRHLGLDKGSSVRAVCAGLRALRNLPSAHSPKVLFLNDLTNFDDICMDALISALQRQPGLFGLNLGDEAGRMVTQEGWSKLTDHLRGPGGARIVCQFMSDTWCPDDVRQEVRKLCGKERREETEAKARALLACGKKDAASRMVPWRDPRVHDALGHDSVDWGMATWHPKVSWPEIGTL